MTIADVAAAAIAEFSPSDAVTMVAIAGAESGFNPRAQGDALSIFIPSQQTAWAPFAVDGFLSFGPWQVFLGVHTLLIQRLSGKTLQADLAEWLYQPANSAKAAKYILDSQGFKAWSVYNNGAYRQFLNEAGAAVATALAADPQLSSKLITAVSIAPPHLHIDFEDGSYTETDLLDVGVFGPWIRFNVRGVSVPAGPQLPLL